MELKISTDSNIEQMKNINIKISYDSSNISIDSNLDGGYLLNNDTKGNEFKFCTKCFSKNLVTNKFCYECGNNLFACTLEEAKKNHSLLFKKGSIILFGSYPQNINVFEPLRWDILDVRDNKALLLSHNIIDSHIFDRENNNYANSEIRRWLNNEFYNKAFSDKEKEMILVTDIDNSERSTNPYIGRFKFNNGVNNYACNNTKDKIFLLSEYEITNPNYGFSINPKDKDIKLRKKVTPYAKSKGVYECEYEDYLSYGCFFLRSLNGYNKKSAFCVDYDGYKCADHYVYRNDIGVVPAMWVKI